MWIGLNKRKMSKGKQDGFRSAHTQIHIKLLGIQWQDANTICNESQSPKGRKTKSLLLKNTIVSDNETWAEMSPLFLQITWYHIISKVHDDIFTINTRLIFAGLLLIMYFSCFHHMRNKAKKKKNQNTHTKTKSPVIREQQSGLLGRRRSMLDLHLWVFSSMDFRVPGAEIPDYRASPNPQTGCLYATRLVPIVSL